MEPNIRDTAAVPGRLSRPPGRGWMLALVALFALLGPVALIPSRPSAPHGPAADPVERCTLSREQWQNFTSHSPRPEHQGWLQIGAAADEAWMALGVPGICPPAGQCGQDTPFFLSRLSWSEVFWVPSAGSNAYYRLAPQYMASTLNRLSGANFPEHVQRAWSEATDLLRACRPNDFAPARDGRFAMPAGACAGDAAQVVAIADVLRRYNEGLEGVPPCSISNLDRPASASHQR